MTRSRYIVTIFILCFTIINFSCETKDNVPEQWLSSISGRYLNYIPSFRGKMGNPRTQEANGKIIMVPSKDWTSGFYPGCLWYLFELTHDTVFKQAAEERTQIMEPEQYNGKTHDMGFKMYCSFGNGYRLTHKQAYKTILLQSARTLATRYNPKVGCIRSWDHHDNIWQYPVIIDNMMNLELLFWAFDETHDSLFYNIACNHALNTMKNHYRSDYSSYHVVDYDSITGKVLHKQTHQGFSDVSAWARGQAWGLYGFTMVYRETRDVQFLSQAEHIADFIFNNPNLPDDFIPYWDFNDSAIPDAPRDASAAAISASALYELCRYDSRDSAKYKNWADKIMVSLSSDKYRTADSVASPFFLEHSTGNKPKNDEVDVPIIYADYYYLEALKRKVELEGVDFSAKNQDLGKVPL